MTITQYRSYQDRFPAEPTEELDVEMEEAAEELSKEVAGGRKYNVYSDKHKAVFYYFNRVKLWKAAPSARKAQVEIRTGQIWAKRLKEDPQWNIYEKQTNKVNRLASQLQENHKKHLIDFFDIYPQATRQDAVESLTEAFENFNLKTTAVGNFILYECNLTVKRVTLQPLARNSLDNREKRYNWVKKWEGTDMKYLQNCVFVDEAGFSINMRSPNARSIRGTPAIVETPTSRALSHTILGAISANDVITIEIREPMRPKKVMRFVSKTLDEMDKFPEMTNFYIVMDNAPIHTSHEITRMIEARGYRAIYLPPYSPELNPIENFWSILKASKSISRKTLHNITQHSVDSFEICLKKEPL
ncbi:hypothetical protein RMCBS344292_05319 [Rhizopus microsporus]|nr:hypothetical protein RMCBS344292_05319 [Rhizopus microsporus]